MNTKKNTTEIGVKRLRATLVVLGGGAFLALTLQGLLSSVLISKVETTDTGSLREELSAPATDPFANTALEARAAYVVDLSTKKILFAKNENEKLPLASVTKLMTTLVARDHMRSDAVVTLSKDDLAAEGDSGLRPGERWRMGDILDVMLLVSSNDAAHAVAGFVGADGLPSFDMERARLKFVNLMNEKAHALGLSTMEFFNESGLDVENTNDSLSSPSVPQTGGYGSARDVAALMATLWQTYPTTLEITARKDARIISQDKIAHILLNTNEAAGRYAGLIASKTGYTDLAGGNLVILFDVGVGHPVVAVVLGSSYKGRFEDMHALTQATLKALE